MKLDKKKTLKSVVILLFLAVIALFLFKPSWIPFLDDATRTSVSDALRNTFNSSKGDYALLSLPTLFSVVAVIVVVWLVTGLLRLILNKLPMRNKRSETVRGLLLSVVKYAGWLVGIVWALSAMGVNVGGIFASLGILSLIIGFGAQSLIEDVITGVFIIFEGQYNVGDIIVLDDFRGTVQRIGVRTTSIMDAGGNIKIVNNSDIRNLQNRSQQPSVAVSDVGIPYSASVVEVEKILEKELHRVRETYPDVFTDDAKYVGVQELGASAVVLRVIADTTEENVYSAQRKLNRMLKLIMDEHGIEIPFQQVVVHNSGK